MTAHDEHVWAWRRWRGMQAWRVRYEAAGPQKHAADLAAIHDAERHADRVAAARKPWQFRDVVVPPAEQAERAAEHAAAAERCAALAASPLADRRAAGMPTVPAADLLAFAHAEWDEAAAFLSHAERARIEGKHPGPWRRPPEPSLRAACKLVDVSIVAARIVEHAGGREAAARHGAWAPAGVAHATWATAAADWIAQHDRAAASDADTADAAEWKAYMSRKTAAVADLHARAARALAPALEDLAGEQAVARYARVRGHWLAVARDLPPTVRAEIMSRPRMPARPALRASLLQYAADHAADQYGAALGAVAAADDPAGGAVAAVCRRRCIAEALRAAADDPAGGGPEPADIAGAVADAATATAERAAALRAACPAPADMVAAVRAKAVQDFGARVTETAQYELVASGRTAHHFAASGPRAYAPEATARAPAARSPVPPNAAPLRPAAPLGTALVADLRTAVRPGVDLLAIIRGYERPRHDKDYEYARGTYAEQAAAETEDISSTAKYIEAMNEGRLIKDTVAELEFPGSLFGRRCTCGLPIALGHRGDEDSGYDGEVELRPGLMSCNSRGCLRDWQRWKDKEALRMRDKLIAGVQRARLADEGAAGGKRTPLIHLVISFQPEDHEAWAYGGAAERARLRKAALAELNRRGRFWGWAEVDHSYRFTEGLKDAYLSPHLHVIAVGWLDYKLNAARFLEFKDVPYEVRTMRMAAGATAPAERVYSKCPVPQVASPTERTIERKYGRCRGVFIKHLSTVDTAEDTLYVCGYVLSHSTASARRLGETSGGEHTVRWGGALANGRTQVATVSRFEAGDLVENARAKVPSQITALTVWHSAPSDEGEDTVSRAEPRHVWTGSGPAECAEALRAAAADTQRDHPASAKNGGVVVRHVIDHPDGPPVMLVEAVKPEPEDGLPPDDYLILKLVGHSRPEATRVAAIAAKQAVDTYQALTHDSQAMHVPGSAGSDIAAAAQQVQGAAMLLQYANEGAPEQGADLRRQASAKLREGRVRLDAAAAFMYGNLNGASLAGYAERVGGAARAVARAVTMSNEKSRWVVLRVNSRLDHLSSDGHRLEMVVWDPGGAEKADKMPALPSAIWEGLGMGALDEDVPDDDDDERPIDARRRGVWLRMPAAGWLTVREWMQRYAAPYPPAYDPLTRRLVLEDGILSPSPYLDAAPIETQRGVTWDVLYSQVRAHRRASRGRDAGPVTREDVRAHMAAHYMRPPAAA